MNTKDEALLMAIEALEESKNTDDSMYKFDRINKAIIACNEALEQPTMTYEQGFDHGYEAHRVEQEALNLNCKSVQKRLATQWGYVEQPAQEPVAWMHRHDGEITEFNDFQSCQYCEPLYTHPAPSWQGLSDDEILAIPVGSRLSTSRAIEQALRNKNGY